LESIVLSAQVAWYSEEANLQLRRSGVEKIIRRLFSEKPAHLAEDAKNEIAMNPSDQFGLSCALALPIDDLLVIDYGRLLAHARWCLDAGCSSLTVFGTTGEGASVSLPEREQVLNAFLSAGIDPGRQIVGGVSATSIGDAVEQTRILNDAGCHRILLAPSFYFKGVSDEGLYEWFARVCESIAHMALGVFLYHIPPVTQVPLSIDLIGRLKTAFPEVVAGVKDSGGDWAFTERLLVEHGDLIILIGDERHLGAGLRLGAKGSISGLANICPAVLLKLIKSGKEDLRISDLVTEILKYPVTPAVKALLAHCKQDSRWSNVRPPLSQLAREETAHLTATYRSIFPTEG
jgi:4-hydroxy-tetrahydrodipicolinate synthase